MRGELGLAPAERAQHGDDDQLALAGIEARAAVHVTEGEVDDPITERSHAGEELGAAGLITQRREALEAAGAAVVRA